MHELGIVFHVIKSVEEIAQENELTKVSAVTLSIGEVSGIVPSYLTDCWRWAADRTEVLSGSELNIETIHAVTHCDDCGCEYDTVAHGKICPECGGEHTWLLCGNETMIKEIEVPEEDQIREFLQKKGYDPEQTDQKEKGKLMMALARKGFAYEAIRSVMGEWLDT